MENYSYLQPASLTSFKTTLLLNFTLEKKKKEGKEFAPDWLKTEPHLSEAPPPEQPIRRLRLHLCGLKSRLWAARTRAPDNPVKRETFQPFWI